MTPRPKHPTAVRNVRFPLDLFEWIDAQRDERAFSTQVVRLLYELKRIREQETKGREVKHE